MRHPVSVDPLVNCNYSGEARLLTITSGRDSYNNIGMKNI